MNSRQSWPEITIGSREENLNLLYNMVVHDQNLDILGKTCRLFLKKKGKCPHTSTLLKLAVENQDRLQEEEKAEIWSEVLEKFTPGRAFYLARKYLPKEWKTDFIDSLFIQNGRASPSMKKGQLQDGLDGRIPEWMLRNPFGIARQLKLNPKESKPVLSLLKERQPESYPAHTVLFVDAFLSRDVDQFLNHYYQSGRVKFHPQSLYMKAIIAIRRGEDDSGERLLQIIRDSVPDWEIPKFLMGGTEDGSFA
jgi:hypothetical protein